MLHAPKDSGLYWLGLSGGAPGANAISIWSPQDDAFVSVALTGDASAPATANVLPKALAKAKSPLTQFKQN
jgi:D-alanyl-D-alanine carboxypeptidase